MELLRNIVWKVSVLCFDAALVAVGHRNLCRDETFDTLICIVGSSVHTPTLFIIRCYDNIAGFY